MKNFAAAVGCATHVILAVSCDAVARLVTIGDDDAGWDVSQCCGRRGEFASRHNIPARGEIVPDDGIGRGSGLNRVVLESIRGCRNAPG